MKQFLLLLASVFVLGAYAQPVKDSYKFDFGPGKVQSGYTQVLPSNVFSYAAGFGFDLGTTPEGIDRGGNALTGDFVTGSKPFYFSVALPEGNYRVTITMGDSKEAAKTTVKMETRRLFVEHLSTAPGKFETRTFTVNIRNSKLGDGQVSLKSREVGKLTWDNKLTFEFNDERPCVVSIEITPDPNAITVFLAGDSTLVDQDNEPWCGWGQMITRWFKEGLVFANYAESGETLGAFRGEKRLAKLLTFIRPGDYLFVEFGHNDMKANGPNDGAFKSYKTNLEDFVKTARDKGALPILVTPMHRRGFDDNGKVRNSLGDYPDAVRLVAKEQNVPLLDLNNMSAVLYETLGVEGSKNLFVIFPAQNLNDNTHFNPYGGYELAKCIIEMMKAQPREFNPILKYLRPEYKKFDPAQPDPFSEWNWPASIFYDNTKPEGN